MSHPTTIPNDLELVIDFVNTLDIEAASDELSDAQALAVWLTRRDLLRPGEVLDEADLGAAVRLREALRAAMLAHNGAAPNDAAARELDEAASRGGLGVRFPTLSSVHLQPLARGLDGALASLLVPVAHAVLDGSWLRVKACGAEGCRWAFYDRSRNRSGTWCEMAVCGNRTKVRAYRARTSPRGRTSS